METVAAASACVRRVVAGRWSLPWAALLIALSAVFPGAHAAAAQTAQQSDPVAREIKAAYLYKFASYVEWPAGTFAHKDSSIVIGVTGADLLAAELERMVVGKRANGRVLAVRRLQPGDALAGVHILFVGNIGKQGTAETFASARGQPVLIVSDSRQAHALGSMINFVVVDERLRFAVALRPAARSGLRLSALMLTAAYAVAQEPR